MENKCARRGYPSDVSDEEWVFVEPFLTLIRPDAAQREYDLREIYNGLRYLIRTGCPWRYLPHDLPPWWAVLIPLKAFGRSGRSRSLIPGEAVQAFRRKPFTPERARRGM